MSDVVVDSPANVESNGRPPSVSPPRAADESARFVRQVHEIVRDLLTPKPAVFFADFLASIVVAYAAFAVYLTAANFSALQIAAFLVAAITMYRAAIFIHEIEHRPPRTFSAFRITWNALCGIPFGMPSFLYDDHVGHHSHLSYGTKHDAEYLSLVHNRPLRATLFLAIGFIYPVLGPLRFLLQTPLMIVVPIVNRRGWINTSSLYMLNPSYRRKIDAAFRSRERWAQEIAGMLFFWTLAVLLWQGVIPVEAVWKSFLLFAAWMGMNQLRTMTAHRYGRSGEPTTYAGQILDSNTFDRGGILPELWAPVGLRYHALHHVMPALPYHAMGEAHCRLLERLPADSPYRETLQPSLWAAFVESFVGGRPRRGE